MNRVSKAIFTGLGGVAVAFGAVSLGANGYLRSEAVRVRVERSLEGRFGARVELRAVGFTPWGGVSVEGLRVHLATHAGAVLEVERVQTGARLLPLLRGKLVFGTCRLSKPCWIVGGLPGDAPVKTLQSTVAGVLKKGLGDVEGGGGELYSVQLPGRFEVVDGEVFHGAAGPGQTRLAGVQCAMEEAEGGGWRGRLKVGVVVWHGVMAFEGVEARAGFSGGRLVLDSVAGNAVSGRVEGSFSADLGEDEVPFQAVLRGRGLDLALLSERVGWREGRLAGRCDGELSLRRGMGAAGWLDGTGRFEVHNGSFIQVAPLRMVGEVLQIDELARMDFSRAQGQLRLGEAGVRFEELVADSPSLRLSLAGSIGYDGTVAMDGRMGVEEKIYKGLPPLVREGFSKGDAGGLPALSFKLGGTVDRPSTDLVERFLGRRLAYQLGGAVDRLFGSVRSVGRGVGSRGQANPSAKSGTDVLDSAESAVGVPSGAGERDGVVAEEGGVR